MKKVAFIGSFDKADMIIYAAKILTLMGKSVLVVDSTALQKTRYIIPSMEASKQYITTYEKIDIAIGFENLAQIKEYKTNETKEEFNYDYVLLDIDNYKWYVYFGVKPDDKHFFITSFDLYCLRRGLQVFRRLENPVEVTKVLFTKEMLPEEEQFLAHLSKGLKIKWDNDVIYFPFELGDQNAIFSNQRSGRIRMRGLSQTYVDGIMYMVEELSGASSGDVRKAAKNIER